LSPPDAFESDRMVDAAVMSGREATDASTDTLPVAVTSPYFESAPPRSVPPSPMRAVVTFESTATATAAAASNENALSLVTGFSSFVFFDSFPLHFSLTQEPKVERPSLAEPISASCAPSRRSSPSSLPTPAAASVPLDMVGISSRTVVGTCSLLCFAETVTNPPTVADPSRNALVSPSSIDTAAEMARSPSLPAFDVAAVRLRSIVVAVTNKSPPMFSTASSVTWALMSESRMLSAPAAATRFTSLASLAALIV
jgi:hypothetical protein